MKKVLFLTFVFASLAFARMSAKHQIVSPPNSASFIKVSHGVVSAQDYIEDDLSAQWKKRRHKRRKKTRGRQRGR